MDPRGFKKTITGICIGAIVRAIRNLPYPAAVCIGRTAAILAWIIDHDHRNIAKLQLEATMGPQAPGTLGVFMNQGDILVDSIRYAFYDDATIARHTRIEGRHNLEEALASKRGVMLMTGHMGNWEILAHLPRIMDTEFCVMADTRRNRALEEVINDLRSRSGATILPPEGKALMLVRELRKGRTIGMVIDQRGKRSDGLFCDFLGLPAPTNPAPAFIALKGEALVVPLYAIRRGSSYTIHIDPAIDTSAFPRGRKGLRQLSEVMQSWVGKTIRKHPSSWFWPHSRWTRRPEMIKIIREGKDFRRYTRDQARRIESGDFT